MKLGTIAEGELTNFLSKQYRVPAINLEEFEIDAEIIKLVPKEVAEKHQVIPVTRAGASLIVAMSDPSNLYAIDDIKFLTGYNVEPVVARETAIARGHRALLRRRRAHPTTRSWRASTRTRSSSAPTEDDVNVLELEKAAERRAGRQARAT